MGSSSSSKSSYESQIKQMQANIEGLKQQIEYYQQAKKSNPSMKSTYDNNIKRARESIKNYQENIKLCKKRMKE